MTLAEALRSKVVTLSGARQRVKRHHCVQVFEGRLKAVANQELVFGADSVWLAPTSQEPTGEGVRTESLCDVVGMVEEYSYGETNYRDAKGSKLIQELYMFGRYRLNYMTGIDNQTYAPQWSSKEVEGYPCHYCGLLIPDKLVQLDHQRPKTGGRVTAVAKVLRWYGLTRGPGKGPKHQAMALGQGKGGGKRVLRPIAPKGQPTGDAGQPGNWSEDKKQRYTTNVAGTALISVLHAAELYKAFEARCVNSNINLVPSCGACNRARSNRF
ncbi:MAG: hypothetical protein AAF581_07705 [Planctomycetota bacterium]